VRIGLSKPSIVQAALDVLDAEGMDGVTVRAVARRLGVQAPALYWHVKNKQELLDEMGTEIWRRVGRKMLALDSNISLHDRLTGFATIVRDALLSHRDGAKAFTGTYLTDADVLQRQESMFARMIDAGFSLEDTVRGYSLLYSFTVGFCVEEQAVASVRPGDDRYSPARRSERLDADRYPLVVASGRYFLGDADERFTDLVNVIVQSIERMRTA